MIHNKKNKLLLVDGSALLHRAYHAYPALTTRKGQVVGAVYGVVSMLISALEEVQPTQVVVAWDLPEPTFRHSLYVAYKAQRVKAEPEMVEQIPTVKETVEAMGIMQLEQAGYEADDIIGTLARAKGIRNKEVSEKSEVVILTGDMDLTQLVTERVKLLTPPRGKNPAKLYGPEEVEEKYGVTPEQMVDYKALVGDPSDNIPGVRGVGPKTAAQLIQDFGNLEAIYGAVNPKLQILNPKQAPNSNVQISETIKKKLLEGEESAYLSRDLSRIVTEMKIEVERSEMEYGGLQGPTLKGKLTELNFRSLIRRIWGDPTPSVTTLGVKNQMGLF